MYQICLNIKINTVTCPGVWLCPKGEVMLKIQTLSQTQKTKRIRPKFPLNFAQKLSFRRMIIGGVESIADVFENEEIRIELIQWMITNSKLGVVLAKFSQHLRNIFDSFIIDEHVTISSMTNLLMCRTEYFPGIISPKISVIFELLIESNKSPEKMVSSLSSENFHEPHLERQRRVCHSKSNYPYNCSLCSACDSFRDYTKPTSSCVSGTCDCNGDKVHTSFCTWCNYIDSMKCKCCCCLKYHLLFH